MTPVTLTDAETAQLESRLEAVDKRLKSLHKSLEQVADALASPELEECIRLASKQRAKKRA